MQSHSYCLEDYRWLVSDAAAPWLERVTADSRDTLAIAGTLRKDLSVDRAHLVLEQAELRRRGLAKFPNAGRMFFTRKGLEQATDWWVARHKALRFSAGSPVADLCCGIGGDLLGIAGRGTARGVDRDPLMTLLGEANCDAVSGANVLRRLLLAEVAPSIVAEYSAWHIDPDRRPHGHRTTRVEFHEPGPELIDQLRSAQPNAAIKLAPAATLPDHWPAECECEWISRAGECRQLVAWFGGLTDRHGSRAATVLDASGKVLRQVYGDDMSLPTVAPQVGCYVFEPDSAVLAAKLIRAIAIEHGLEIISPGIAYLTGDALIDDAALDAFEVLEVLPFRAKQIKAILRERGIGRLEVKKRGVELDPARLQRELRGEGSEVATLIVTRIGKTVTAILARRATKHASPA